MNGFRPPSRLEKQYANAMERLVNEAFAAAQFSGRGIVDFLQSYTQTEMFQKAAKLLAKKFVYSLLRNNTMGWKNKAKQTAKSREIYLALQKEMEGPVGQLVNAQIDRNAFYITNLPLDISKLLTKKILERQQKGLRFEQMVPELMKIAPGLTKQRINLIARTEASKASTALTRAQSYELGLDWYVWRTSEDGRVRSSHAHLNGVLVKWTDPPSPELLIGETNLGRYNAGEIFNCRCFAEPVIDLKYLTWPHKVYSNGQIVKMNRTTFESRVA